MKVLLTLLTMVFASCGSLVIHKNCVLTKVNEDNFSYYVGPCFDTEGNVESVHFRWENQNDTEFKADVSLKGAVVIEYREPSVLGGETWVSWSSKSGIMLGRVPPEVEDALYPSTK